ncbi:MAG: Ada metal-binding domain-containing protein [Desulfotignum sp.]|nr:Ada metal-binding domain-containing protein [Desulfotignum sp.]
MKMIIGGAVAFLLGIFTIIIFSARFFDLVLGVVPVTLILAGGLMIYLNRETLLSKKDHDPTVEETVIEESVVKAPATEEPIIEKPVVQESKLVGNTESKIFHTQDCNFAQSKKCTDFFATTQDAVQAGYKPCSRCNP